jgi:hypothetical protein
MQTKSKSTLGEASALRYSLNQHVTMFGELCGKSLIVVNNRKVMPAQTVVVKMHNGIQYPQRMLVRTEESPTYYAWLDGSEVSPLYRR